MVLGVCYSFAVRVKSTRSHIFELIQGNHQCILVTLHGIALHGKASNWKSTGVS